MRERGEAGVELGDRVGGGRSGERGEGGGDGREGGGEVGLDRGKSARRESSVTAHELEELK